MLLKKVKEKWEKVMHHQQNKRSGKLSRKRLVVIQLQKNLRNLKHKLKVLVKKVDSLQTQCHQMLT